MDIPDKNGNHRLQICVLLLWTILISLRKLFLDNVDTWKVFIIMIDTNHSWLLTATPFNFETDDDIWWRDNCVSWLIISIVFTSEMRYFKITVYLTIIMIFVKNYTSSVKYVLLVFGWRFPLQFSVGLVLETAYFTFQ